MSDSTGISHLDTLVVWISALAVLGTAAGVLWRWSRGLRRIAHRFDEFADDWQGTEARPGVPARPGVMERLACFDRSFNLLDHRLARVEHEMHPNSGGSMRDAIDRVERQVCEDRNETPGALRTA